MLRIILEDGRTIGLTGRVAEMGRWLVSNQERINRMEQGSVTLDFSGTSLKPRLVEVGNAIKVGPSSKEGPREGLGR